MISIIVAIAANGVIGDKNDLPWYLPADLRHFKDKTTGHAVIMGRNTYQSIVDRLHGPLPNRRNIVVSKSLSTPPQGFELAESIEEALNLVETDSDIFLIGGSQLYGDALAQDLVDKLYITEIHTNVNGDVIFPVLNFAEWKEVYREPHKQDDKNPYDYDFIEYEKVR